MTSLFDAHCHVDRNAPYVMEDVRRDGPVKGRLLCGVDPSDWDAVNLAASRWVGTIPAFGLHPWYAGAATGEWLETIEKLLATHPGAWLGEAGLDRLRIDRAPEKTQEEVFRAQLRLAARLGRKINLHCVKAWEPLVAALDAEYLTAGADSFIVHSFSGPHQYIKALVERGAYFSVGPLFSKRDSPRHRQRVALLPENRLLLESDEPLKPGVDAADDLLFTLEWLAAARKSDARPLAERIDENTAKLFGA